MALTYEKFYGGVSNAEQLMYKKSCVYSKSKEGKLKWLVKKYLVEFFLKASGIVALSSMELNSGLTAFADHLLIYRFLAGVFEHSCSWSLSDRHSGIHHTSR